MPKRNNKWYRLAGGLILAGLLTTNLRAQTNGLLQRIDLADTYRVYQLTDSAKTAQYGLQHRSFALRPYRYSEPDTGRQQYWIALDNIGYSRYYNNHIPTGYNNESFYQATGWQDRLTLGIKAKLGRLTIDLQPEFVVAQNKEQAGIDSSFRDANFFSRYYFMNINVIDLPSRFGTQPVQRLFPGQSSIRYHIANDLSVGLSTENIWWGPGKRNSLVMTNNAPGFLHATVNTNQPIKTGIGSFEGQVLYGFLDSSGVEPVENERQRKYFWPGAYVPKISQANRHLFGYMFSWQPRWAPNFYIGMTAAYYFYDRGSDTGGRPFPEYPYTASPAHAQTASLGSLFFRYAMPVEQAEMYLEIGRGDKAANPFNLFGDTIPIGYTAGLRKLFSLPQKGRYIELSGELTHLQLPDARLIFNNYNPHSIPKTNSWYTNPYIRQGYTHYGQLLGAGVGPGGNSQTLNLSWIDGFNRLGLHVERVVHSNDFYYYAYYSGNIGNGYASRYWTDLNLGLHGQRQWKQFMLAGAIDYTSSLNYQWVKIGGTNDGPSPLSDKKNLHLALSVVYRLNQFFPLSKRK